MELTQVEEARRQLSLFRELEQFPAWVELREAANAQIASRRNKYYRNPLKAGQTIEEQQWELGEAAGIEFFVKLPEIMIQSARTIIEEWVKNNEPPKDETPSTSG